MATSAWFVVKETTDSSLSLRIEREQRSEGKYGNDKGYGRIADCREDEAEDLPQQKQVGLFSKVVVSYAEDLI